MTSRHCHRFIGAYHPQPSYVVNLDVSPSVTINSKDITDKETRAAVLIRHIRVCSKVFFSLLSLALFLQLGNRKFATVSEFKGKTLVQIREYYEKDGQMLPGKKGKVL